MLALSESSTSLNIKRDQQDEFTNVNQNCTDMLTGRKSCSMSNAECSLNSSCCVCRCVYSHSTFRSPRPRAHLTQVASRASFAGWERKKGLLCSLPIVQQSPGSNEKGGCNQNFRCVSKSAARGVSEGGRGGGKCWCNVKLTKMLSPLTPSPLPACVKVFY